MTNIPKEEQLIKENEIMGNIFLDIVLHNDSISDERITELLNQENWKERAGFKVMDSKQMVSCKIG
jgi:hypothetical protein